MLTLLILPYKQLSSAIHCSQLPKRQCAPIVCIARDLQDSPKMPDALLAFAADVSCARRSLFRDVVVSQRKNGGSGGRVLSLLVFPKGEGERFRVPACLTASISAVIFPRISLKR